MNKRNKNKPSVAEARENLLRLTLRGPMAPRTSHSNDRISQAFLAGLQAGSKPKHASSSDTMLNFVGSLIRLL